MSDLDDVLKHSPLKSPATAEEREQQLFAQMGKPRLLKAMDKFFLETPDKYEAEIPKPTKRLETGGCNEKDHG
ncbi:BZ3500_MvSof-1268-A1-R1_Chr1-2g01364 [Microbotryum saponariae]|uniref:BZ3500_MvSof-1268-A1-R1_Chr1-2g01363 protein n=1 Tax=Microbotryum saponariae TaxID=289078 RepID=A0A2X0LLX6_9BASI|nr:BZ3500_MvSof-1268-A1-R1_Chr1-2g01363 [Microbotryum saponariae]SCZ91368.1 BZ3500_MvSof-1268-A1-R1_Chr1-2g01364 [Microbotryum saponariae]SCZ97212.1 BZ3501_MvSof-1269-A2-R1_Chr1-2g00962 [Microbotryum saponariae]SCZ97213.1 BZ3501_MvSof-1269-A2-R1_Chr1-2g00963 [Microbotryum saponariae]